MAAPITCKRLDLLAALNIVMPVIETRNTIPILATLLISAAKNKITLEGTDLDLRIKYSGIKYSGNKAAMSLAVPAKALYEFIKNSTPDGVVITADPNHKTANFVAGATRFLPLYDPKDFPEERKYETPARFEMSFGEMLTIIQTIKPAISTEETRYYLNGMFFEPRDINNLCVTATDGHRMHTMTVKADGLTAKDAATPVIVPTKTILVVEKWLTGLVKAWAKSKDPSPTFSVAMGRLGTKFYCGQVVIDSKNIDGTFPDWRRVVPKTMRINPDDLAEYINDKVVTLDSKKLDSILKVVSKIYTESHPRATKFSLTNGKLELSINDHDGGRISDVMPCDYTGTPLEIGFNGKYVREAMSALSADKIELVMADAGSPTICRKAGVENPFCVLMPMRV